MHAHAPAQSPAKANGSLLSLAIALLLVAGSLALTADGLLPLTLALLGSIAACAVGRQAMRHQPKTVTV